MKIVDAHHHLWNLDKLSYPWLAEPVEHFVGDYSPIRRHYLISDFLQDANQLELVKSVHLEADFDRTDDPVKETGQSILFEIVTLSKNNLSGEDRSSRDW